MDLTAVFQSMSYVAQSEILKPLLAVFYANLDPEAIPRDGELLGVPAALAIISLKGIRRIGFPVEAAVDLWPRIWNWMYFIQSHSDEFPPEAAGMDICTDFLLFVGQLIRDPFAAEMIRTTTGVRNILARAWTRMFRDTDGTPDEHAMAALSTVLKRLDFTKDPAHLQEVLDGAGGTLGDFSQLIVWYIDFLIPTSTVDLSAEDYNHIDSIWYPLNGLGNKDSRDALRQAGLISSLSRMMCALARYSGPRSWARDDDSSFTSDDDLMGAALIYLMTMLEDPPRDEMFRQAIRAGILRPLVLYGIQGAEVVWTTKFMTALPITTLYCSVISLLESALRDVQDLVELPAFRGSAIFGGWNNFYSLAKRRIALAKLWKSANSLSRYARRACDNMEVCLCA